MTDLTLPEAILRLLTLSRSSEACVAFYIYLKDRDVQLKEITNYFNWGKYITAKKVAKLIRKKVIVRKFYHSVALNCNYKEWCDGKVAISNQEVATDFDLNVTQELFKDLVNFAKTKGLQEEDAEDIVQSSLLKARERFTQFKPNTNFKNWILTIVGNGCYDFKKKRRELQVYDTELEEIAGSDDICELLDLKSDILRYKYKFQELERYDQFLLLQYSNNVPYKEVGILMNIPENTVKSKIFRAKIKFQELLKNP